MPTRAPPVAHASPRRTSPWVIGSTTSTRERNPSPVDARRIHRSPPVSGRYSVSPRRTDQTMCVTATRPWRGRSCSIRTTTARRTASRANARAPHNSCRSVSRATGVVPRHSAHRPCRVPRARARDEGSRRAPCCCSSPYAIWPWCPKSWVTSSAARAPMSPDAQRQNAMRPVPRTEQGETPSVRPIA